MGDVQEMGRVRLRNSLAQTQKQLMSLSENMAPSCMSVLASHITSTSMIPDYRESFWTRGDQAHHVLFCLHLTSNTFGRSQIYSSRPTSVVGDIVTDNLRTVLMPYNTRWRASES